MGLDEIEVDKIEVDNMGSRRSVVKYRCKHHSLTEIMIIFLTTKYFTVFLQ